MLGLTEEVLLGLLVREKDTVFWHASFSCHAMGVWLERNCRLFREVWVSVTWPFCNYDLGLILLD